MKYFKLYEEVGKDFNISKYVEKEYGYENIHKLEGTYSFFISDVVKYLQEYFETYFIEKGNIELNNITYFLFVEDSYSVDITIIEKNDIISINMINASDIGTGLGTKVINLIKDYSINNDISISVANVTNELFWEKLGFIKSENSIYKFNFDNKIV